VTSSPCPLGRRELETVRWLSNGKTAQETAELMSISVHTVNRNVTNSKDRTGTSKTVSLVAMALREGWIP
jgi:DNA-binding CsgD family transcriptional regulator